MTSSTPSFVRSFRLSRTALMLAVLPASVLFDCSGEDPEPEPEAPPDSAAESNSSVDSPIAGAAVDLPYQPCSDETAVGGFRIELADSYTLVQGQVFDAIEPARVPVEVMTSGECRLLLPPSLLCEPGCAFSTETCGPQGQCLPLPIAHDLGTVNVTGLVIPVEMSANERTKSYSNPARPALPHPGFDPGADLRLTTGGGDYDAFELRGWGVSPLTVLSQPVRVDPGLPTSLEWEASTTPSPAQFHVDLDINVHGSGGARIECDFPDTGSAEIPASLIDALIAEGLSGFPTITLSRQTITSKDTAAGCVELVVSSAVNEELALAGIVSCNVNDDCDAGQTCLPIVRNCG